MPIQEFAKLSGLDKVENNEVKEEAGEMEGGKGATSVATRGCRVTMTGPGKLCRAGRAGRAGGAGKLFTLLQPGTWAGGEGGGGGGLQGVTPGRAETKLRSNKNKKKKFRNLEGLLAIQVRKPIFIHGTVSNLCNIEINPMVRPFSLQSGSAVNKME